MVHKGVPWSMDQFKRLYNSVRTPGDPQDDLLTPFRTGKSSVKPLPTITQVSQSLFWTVSEGPSAANNVVVICRGYIFSFDGVLPGEEILTPQELAYQLYYIEKWCQAQERDGPGIGAMTTSDRSVWAQNRQYLTSLHRDNKRNLDIIEGAICVYVLDESEPLTQTDVSIVFFISQGRKTKLEERQPSSVPSPRFFVANAECFFFL